MPGDRAGDKSSCVARRVVSQPRKSREREATNEHACKHGHLSLCNEIRCQNAPTKTSGVHLNIIKCFKGYNIGFYS